MAKRNRSTKKYQTSYKIELGLLIFATVWIVVTVVVFIHGGNDDGIDATENEVKKTKNQFLRRDDVDVSNASVDAHHEAPSLLSPLTATADVRGNLGPANVVIQKHPGDDWLKDRWQAASDMGGTAIPGQHWIVLDFGESKSVRVDKVILDWEAAYATLYRIEGSLDDRNEDGWCTLFDGSDSTQETRRSEETSGQSPGVKRKIPLHIVHTLSISDNNCPASRYLRVYIKKPARPWGVSLWQFDVYGWYN